MHAKIPAARRPGFPSEQGLRSIADVDQAHPVAERRQHRTAHEAGIADTHVDQADAKAKVVVMMPATTPTATPATAEAEGLRRSGGRGKRGGAQRNGANETKSKFTKHDHSPNDAPRRFCVGAGYTHRLSVACQNRRVRRRGGEFSE